MSPPVLLVLGLAIMFGALSSLVMVVSVATDYWEYTEYDVQALQQLDNIQLAESQFQPSEHFYKVVIEERAGDNVTHQTYYLRDTYGGIWRVCDKISDAFRTTALYKEAALTHLYLEYACFEYIPNYWDAKDILDPDKGVSLVPSKWEDLDKSSNIISMQNSAASCIIVAILCLATAIITGAYGLWHKQVPVCMVTGVMYSVAGVFLCFCIIIMMAKLADMRNDCYSLDPVHNKFICLSRTIGMGWSIPTAWIAFAFCLFAFAFWLFLARCFRLEKAKAML